MIKLYLVRHGETKGNVEQWYQGSTDIPLNDKGRLQAQCLSEYLKDVHFDGFYSSDLMRAEETAKIIAAPHHMEVRTYKELQEVNFGEWEGHRYDEITSGWPGMIEDFYASEGKMKAPNGESFEEVEMRSLKKVQEILADHKDGDTVFIASHGATIRCLLFGLLGLRLTRIWCFQQFNTAVNVIEYYGERNVMTVMNSTRHLEQMAEVQKQWSTMIGL